MSLKRIFSVHSFVRLNMVVIVFNLTYFIPMMAESMPHVWKHIKQHLKDVCKIMFLLQKYENKLILFVLIFFKMPVLQ